MLDHRSSGSTSPSGVDVVEVSLDRAGNAVADALAHDDRPEALRDRVQV
jgi:hypothetical protein